VIVGEIWCYGQLGKSPLREIPLEVRGRKSSLKALQARTDNFWKYELRQQARSHFGIDTPLLPVAPKTQRWLVEKKKKGNTKPRALTEFEKAERAKKSMTRATDRPKPNEPKTSSAAGSSLTVPTRASATGLQLEFHANVAVLGSHHNIKKARSMEALGEGIT